MTARWTTKAPQSMQRFQSKLSIDKTLFITRNGKGKGNCNCNCKGNCDTEPSTPPTLFRFLFHSTPLYSPFLSFYPFTAIESSSPFWFLKSHASTGQLDLVSLCAIQHLAAASLLSFWLLPPFDSRFLWRREDMFMPWKLANAFRTFCNFGREIYADSPSSIRFGFCNWMRNVTPSRRRGSTKQREGER